MRMIDVSEKTPRAFLIGLDMLGKRSARLDIESSLDELALLAKTAGIEIVGQTYQKVRQPHPATYIGSGKASEVRDWIIEKDATIALFDDELSPRHQRELEKLLGDNVRIMDRTELILDIFAQHAQTREGALQVSLAQYEYRLPRLTRLWTHLARQAGGGSARGGAAGVGLRGPGETQLETDRREISKQIARIKGELELVRAHRGRHRDHRKKSDLALVSLVGYTNAGKSTLLNKLTGSDIYTADQLFATLDPTVRRVSLKGGPDFLLTDTVGFIQKLPTTLVAAFYATLEEVFQADLLLHIIDASHQHVKEQMRAVEYTLTEELGLGDVPIINVFNKRDLMTGESLIDLRALELEFPQAISISSLTGEGVPELLQSISAQISPNSSVYNLFIPYQLGSVISKLRASKHILAELHKDDGILFSVRLDERSIQEFSVYLT